MPANMQSNAAVVGRYHLVERIAVGGMAEIFLACEKGAHGMERLVVIKRILPNLAEDASFVAMFLQEARVHARIGHPNVVRIHELGEADGLPFMAMEYVEGSTLRQLLRAATDAVVEIPIPVALDLVVQACAGAHAVHELVDPQGRPYGLVHRDITPHNLMVDDQGFVKLLDFGIVKARESDHRTQTGVLKGKIAYMSPEQCAQEDLDRRSDVYALGNCLWELLAREKLFQAPNEVGVMQAILTGEVRDLRAIRPEVPDPVINAIERALAPSRDSRWDTADELRRALVHAAAVSDLRLDRDATASFVRRLLGGHHARRRRSVEGALERTLVSFPTAGPPSGSSITTVTSVTQMGLIGMVGALAASVAGGILLLGLVVAVGVGIAMYGLPGEAPVDPYIPPTGEPIHLALAPIFDPDTLREEVEPLRRYLEERVDRPIELTVGDSYGRVASGVVEGTYDYGMLPPWAFLRTRESHPEELLPVATKVYDGSSTFEGLLLVSERSTAVTAADLAGGTLCYSDLGSTTGYLFPRGWLLQQGLDPDADFETRVSGNHMEVLRDLIAGNCDLGGTYTGNYTAASSHDIPVAQLRILAVTGRSPHDTFVAGPAAEPAVTERVRQALLAFHPPTHLGRERLGDLEQITGFEPVDIDAFEPLRHAMLLDQEQRRAREAAE